MLAAISGSQASGKTTIVDLLGQQGFPTIKRKTSRSIQADWGLTLDQINNDKDVTLKFQEEILIRKFEDEQEAADSDQLWFTERTYSDLFVYCLVNLGKDRAYTSWLDEYYSQCIELQQKYHKVFYLRAGHFIQHDDDVNRASINTHYTRMIDLTLLDLTEQMTHVSKLTIIETPSLKQRVDIIKNQAR